MCIEVNHNIEWKILCVYLFEIMYNTLIIPRQNAMKFISEVQAREWDTASFFHFK